MRVHKTSGYTSRVTDLNEVLYCDNNKKSVNGIGIIRNGLINKNVYDCHIIPLVIYLCLLFSTDSFCFKNFIIE